MSISLQKGGNVSLSKLDAGLKKLKVGLGWNARVTDGKAFDLDAVAFLVNEAGKVVGERNFVFYGNLQNENGSVVHSGDNRTGDGDGDDEVITLTLNDIPQDVAKAVLAVSIHEGEVNRQTFGQVSNAYVRCVNAETDVELARYDLSEDSSVETAMIFGEIYRHNGEWKFKAIGQGFAGGLKPLVEAHGLSVSN